MSLKITNLKLQQNLTGTDELKKFKDVNVNHVSSDNLAQLTCNGASADTVFIQGKMNMWMALYSLQKFVLFELKNHFNYFT